MPSSRKQYPFDLIETKWQNIWDERAVFRAWNPGEKVPADHPFFGRHGERPVETLRKYYILDMFPYPSGAGLHVGHPEGYTATDILARYRRMQGWHVLHPMGWDAFGLPAEQYAIKTGQHPRATTQANIRTFRRQIKALGFSYDWSREIDTTAPGYFKWTQWIFLKLYQSWFNPRTNRAEPIETLSYPAEAQSEGQKREYRDSRRLAYVAEAPVNWCPDLGTVLANEEVIDGRSEVGGYPVVRRPMRQWMLRITAYAERLLEDLDSIDWSHSLKEMQRNWIGRSEGARIEFPVAGAGHRLTVFTTRPDTLYGATYMVLAPEHDLVERLAADQWPGNTPAAWKGDDAAAAASPRSAIAAYRQYAAARSDLERTQLTKEKTGVFTGSFAVNPATREQIPIWIADYVLATYGTGAIMAVPAHDARDLEFARRFGLPIRIVVQAPEGMVSEGYVGEGTSINSEFLDGLPNAEAKRKIIAWLESRGDGQRMIQYKLRDWLFSRQRYWGEPFPIVWRDGHHQALSESALPVLPPPLTEFQPTATAEPPLARAKEWVQLPDGSLRETNTMPQWAGSCWYYLRYLDPHNDEAFCSQAAERYWMGPAPGPGTAAAPGVDLYVGGIEHAVLHLLYARFWHKVLFDLGYVSTREPFYKLVNQGLILGEDSQKMSKSRGNVLNPDDLLGEYGADAFRLYEMFMGPLEMVKPWSTKGLEGVYRFLGRVWRLFVDEESETEFEQAITARPDSAMDELERIRLASAIEEIAPSPDQLRVLHQCIKKVTEDLEGYRFNTAISALMIFVNEAISWEIKPRSVLADFLKLLAPFAPHLAEELFRRLAPGAGPVGAGPGSAAVTLAYFPWPEFDPAVLVKDQMEIPVQVNGKLRDRLRLPASATERDLESAALASERLRPWIEGKTVKKIIVVPRKLVNIVLA